MALFDGPYDPRDTPTFKDHFGSPQIDVLPGPLEQFWDDFGTIISKSSLLLDVFKPFWTTNKDDELYLGLPQGWATYWLALFSLLQLPLELFVIIGSIITVSFLQFFSRAYTFFVWKIIQGPPLQVYPISPPAVYEKRHRWIFINGIATGKVTLHEELKVLTQTFGEPILGINNRTYGFISDLMECVFQRSFDFYTKDTRIAVPIYKKFLEDTANVDKVILIAHSQGGIIASQILDQLYSEVSWQHIHGRLEVYTFGSAALHFKNPWLDKQKNQRLVEHMEHYCHEKDMVTAFGALSSVDRKRTLEPYLGRVFVAKDWPGHLLNQHYLHHMFPSKNADFLNRMAYRDPDPKKDKYWVYGAPEGASKAGKVRENSNLWRYMRRSMVNGVH